MDELETLIEEQERDQMFGSSQFGPHRENNTTYLEGWVGDEITLDSWDLMEGFLRRYDSDADEMLEDFDE